MKLNVIDLFSGCGGLSKGFEEAGFNILLGIDNDKDALATFEQNHHNSKAVNIDLSNKDFLKDINNIIDNNKVDVILAGPPCQGFSLTGPRNFDDPRNSLYLSVFKSVEYYRPKSFVIENVYGLMTMWKGKVFEEIKKKFSEELNYDVSSTLINMADYGVPQLRKRVFIVGIDKALGKQFSFPLPSHNKNNYVSCEEALSDLPSRENDIGINEEDFPSPPKTDYQKKIRNGSDKLFNHVGTEHKDFVKRIIAMVPEGGNHKDLPEGVGTSRKFNEAWTRYHSKLPSKTIDTGHRNHFHYKWNRVPTVRENARLQSFKDDFIFLGTKTRQNFQVGNAVPPLFAEILAKKIKAYIA
jgi:DNA (cytosine-5)-methyltransferase 1